MKDLYKILGLPENADDDTIKKAYRKLAKENHPDATGGDKKKTERFKEVNEAYGVLGDKQKRGEYDRLKHAPVGQDGMPQGFDPETFAQVFGGRYGGGAPNVNASGDFDVSDLFSSLFGGGGNPWGAAAGGRGRGRPARGSDMSGTIEVSLRESAIGTRRTIRTGGGSTVEVAIPPGVEDGSRLRVAGQGAPGPKGSPAGDLHLEVRVSPDPNLQRNGADVELELPLTLGEAILGTKVDVPTVEGSVQVSVPPGTSSGAKLRLRGRGIKLSDGSRGDQICRIKIVVPKLDAADPEVRRLVDELDKKSKATSPGVAVRPW